MTQLTSIQNGAQTLLIDADDTLWENNVYFERAIANFISFLEHKEMPPEEVRSVLNEVERGCIVSHGYGLNSFVEALAQTFERVSVEPLTRPFAKPSMALRKPSPNIRSRSSPVSRRR